MKKIKVFHVLSNPNAGGIENMLSEVIPRVDSSICDMRIVNMRDTSVIYSIWDRKGIPYFKLKTPNKFPLTSILELARLLREEKVDVVEIYGLRANIIGRLAAKLAGVPVILTGVLSTDDWRRFYHVWLDRMTSMAVTKWVANAKACKRSLMEREKFAADRIDVIYDGIDVSRWSKNNDEKVRNKLRNEFGYKQDELVFVTVANLRPDKGIGFLIEAIPEVISIHKSVRFLLVGRDLMDGELQEKCKQMGLEEIVTFAGFRSDIKDIYESVNAVVLPSLREGLPICLIEAMSMELPVVATFVSGTPELVDDEKTGFLVPPKDIKALSRALIKIVSNEEIRKIMGVAGSYKVNKMFKIERMVEELLEYYQRHLHNK
ncbi:MAG: glycosyltransferase [Planctomycetota bacterium]|jgi:glycosyltransferase involved in cell wall biosynthesis